MRLLTDAPRSRAQLRDAMARKDVPEDVAEAVLDRFVEVGLIDDAEFAGMLVRTRHQERHQSRRAIAVELRRKGVDDETAQVALEQVGSDDEESAARVLVRRKLAQTASLDAQVRARRTYAALGRRGYPPAMVGRILREELAALDGADEVVPFDD
ncbi:regulatory protein RecX [Cellulomonas sp. HZM]|uniref:regulatory protein RecX n=1 Tax=Cellulomonas sp. HZM TaxID=1454010 RepID=UPI001E28D6DE|nr:regulatory protein RecX [Cellulomonas sp. HZM]